MARVTVEDCIVHVPNRFELVLLAAQRAKQIASGNPLTVPRDNDKDAVVSLREIADLTVPLDGLKEDAINSFSRRKGAEPERKAVAHAEQGNEIEEAFEDARQHIAGEEDAGEAGLSFVEENVEVED